MRTELAATRVGRRRLIAIVAVIATVVSLAIAGTAFAGGGRSAHLTVATTGPPAGQSATGVVRGPGIHRRVRTRTTLGGIRAGRYTIFVGAVTITRRHGRILAGARAYASRSRVIVIVRAGRRTTTRAAYQGIVNPMVRPLPSSFLGVVGSTENPAAIVFYGSMSAPRPGTIWTAGPSQKLPAGLVARVVSSAHAGGYLIVSVAPVPIGQAMPSISYVGATQLTTSSGGTQQTTNSTNLGSPRAGVYNASSSCSTSNLPDVHVRLDSVQVRQASLSAFPPQLRLTLAVRTTESLGLDVADAGLQCDVTLGNIGPFQGAIPVGPVVIPVYAVLPINAGFKVQGSVTAGVINVASTTVASVAAGFRQNAASLSEQGTNV